jgi:pyruvate dehydrogenase E1 component beta subunit
VEEGWSVCGIGAEIIAIVNEYAFNFLAAPPIRVTGADVPMPYAKNLEHEALPNVEKIVNAAMKLLHNPTCRLAV